jgi:hypothetical protein
MRRMLIAVLSLLVLGTRSSDAHHGYADYVTERRITVEGVLEEIQFTNPHVIMRLRTADSTMYICIWQSALWVGQVANVTASTFRIGDQLVINGAPSRSANLKELASLREVRRPRDEWVWRANY